MTHPILSRILMLDHVADERYREHQRRSTALRPSSVHSLSLPCSNITCLSSIGSPGI
jgi:hypothetical protein